MDAVRFLIAKQRICNLYSDGKCWKCPLGTFQNSTHEFCNNFINNRPKEAVHAVEEWLRKKFLEREKRW
mgnify:CR=1 FL=1